VESTKKLQGISATAFLSLQAIVRHQGHFPTSITGDTCGDEHWIFHTLRYQWNKTRPIYIRRKWTKGSALISRTSREKYVIFI